MKALDWSQDIILNNWTAYVISRLKKSLSGVGKVNFIIFLFQGIRFSYIFKNKKYVWTNVSDPVVYGNNAAAESHRGSQNC